MTLAAVRQSACHIDGTEWVSLGEAARLATGESLRTWRWRAQREAVEARHKGRQSLAVKAKGSWRIHRSLDARLSRCPDRPTRDDRAREALLAKYPQHIVDRALKRCRWLRQWRKLCEQRRENGVTDRDLAGRVVAEARAIERPDFRISVRSLYVWLRRYKQIGPDGSIRGVEGLIDQYGSGEGNDPTRSPAAVEFFYELYHTQNKISVATCHEVALREARRRGWAWPASYTATLSWLREHDDLSVTYLMRHGKRAWARRYLPHLQIDYTTIQPGYFYVADHTELDLFVLYKGRQIRPWLTAIQDLRSRCIVGWHIRPTPHSDAILSALRMAFRDWAIPSVMRIDNGRDFTSKAITGFTKQERNRLRRVLGSGWQQIVKRGEQLVECTDSRWLGVTGELGIELIFSIPYAPQSKGTLERWFGTFQDQFSKTFASYCANSPANKPECLQAVRCDTSAVPTLDAVCERFPEYLDSYHRSAHRGIGGQCPLAVWKTAVHLRRAVGDELAFLMDVRGLYRVSGNGVSLKVGSGTFSYGAKSQALKRWVGCKVLVALDANDLSQVWCFTPGRDKRQIIGRLACNEYVEPYSQADDAREAIAEKLRERSIMHKATRASARRTKTMSARLQEHAKARRTELLSTGTDDATAAPRIVPVRTGFEGLSRQARAGFETQSYCPVDSGELEDLFEGDETSDSLSVGDDDQDMEDLFVDSPTERQPDEGLGDLL